MRSFLLCWTTLLLGCLPRPEPAPTPTYPQQPAPQAYAPPPAQPGSSSGAPPYPAQTAAQSPYPQQPYTPQPVAQQPYPAQPYGSQPDTAGPPAPSPPYPQPAPYYPPPQPVQPYAAPPPYAAPYAATRHSPGSREVITDFAAVGSLAAIDLLVRQDVRNGSAGTLIVAAGVLGGGATGWLLTEKLDVDRGAARTTTLGLLVGAANGALLIQPTDWTDADQVLGLLLLGSAVGTASGFAYGQSTDLTAGQSTFIGNLALLGSSTAAFTAIAGSRDGEFGGWEDGALALGLDAGVLGGALIAPSLDWSPYRARLVLASTTIGAFVGGLAVGLITKRNNGDSSNGDLVAGCMTAGMWAGFGLGIAMTRDAEPDLRFRKTPQGVGVVVAPFAGDRGEVGVMAGGSW